MGKKIKDFNSLIRKAATYMEVELQLSTATIDGYITRWRRIRNFMYKHGLTFYAKDLEKKILCNEFANRKFSELRPSEKHFYKSVDVLREFIDTGEIKHTYTTARKPQIIFDGIVGNLVLSFLDYKKHVEHLSSIRLNCYKRKLYLFSEYCKKQSISNIKIIDFAFILNFIRELSCQNAGDIYIVVSALRGFMKYLYEANHLDIDYSSKIPKYKHVNQSKLPSTYSKEEIEKLISSLDRSSYVGKRNYAIVLIIARLGIRASDICKLKFEYLHWETSTIEFDQYKTGKRLILPLLPDIGNAIIDYLRYGRPESEEPYVFLTERPPYGRFMTSNVVTHVVQRAYKKAGIDTKGRRFGPHSLRHSLSSRMLEKQVVLPIITEVLGHENSNSTRYYLRIDIKAMQYCMLEVPPVDVSFYTQKGGIFYEEV